MGKASHEGGRRRTGCHVGLLLLLLALSCGRANEQTSGSGAANGSDDTTDDNDAQGAPTNGNSAKATDETPNSSEVGSSSPVDGERDSGVAGMTQGAGSHSNTGMEASVSVNSTATTSTLVIDQSGQLLGGGTNEHSSSDVASSSDTSSDSYCPYFPSRGSDLSSRLMASSSTPARAPTLTSATLLDGRFEYEGEITREADLVFSAYDDDGQCGVYSSIQDFVHVHAISLQGPGPHTVAFEVWELEEEGLSLSTPHVYQSAEGTAQAVDLDQPCLHWLAPVDESTQNYATRLIASGLSEGTVFIAIGMYDTEYGARYRLEVTSDTSCTKKARKITPGADPASTPFVDPNPQLCQDAGKRNCYPPTSPPSVEWSSCCLTDLPQNPEGKCGVSGNGLCLERQQPGNADDSCPTGDYLLSFPPNMFSDDGLGCCNWRTGRCGLMSVTDVLELGCMPIDRSGNPSEQSCTPDYAAGVIF